MRSFLTKAAVLAVLILPCLTAPAQEIRSIRTLCEVYADGSADVSQIWNVNVVSGTEWYIPVGNLGKMTVEDLRVYENGREFISEGRSWDTHRSLDEKAGRCGILEKGSDGVELCWGQGSYGDHEWLVTYHLTGLVQSLKDSDAFNYMFVNPGLVATPQYVNLIISNKTGGPAWTEENVHFWGFGFEGESWLEEDGIAFESDGRVESMIALVQFDKGLLSPTVERDIKFEKMRKKAFKGSSYAKGSGIDFETLLIILALLAGAFLIIFLIVREIFLKATGAIYKPKIFGTPRIDGYFREAPFGGNLAAGFYVFNNAYRTIFHPEASKGVIGAYLMKWTMDGVLRPIKDESGRKTKVSFQIVEGDEPRTFEDSCEQELFDMVRTASGANLILEDKELETWAKLNYKSFLPWKESVDMTGFSNTLLFSESRTPEAGQEEARRIIQFRNFLNDFTLVAEREVPEVGLWKNYLVFATLFGLAEKVSEAMKKLYPADFEKFSNETIGVNSSYMYNLLWFSSRIGSDAFSNAESAKAAAEAKARGGGGGRTSFGGGGGFSGGGFGGGSR